MSTETPFAEVALALPLRQTFIYRIPPGLASRVRPGAHVQVPFRGRPRRGFVVKLAAESARDSVHELAAVLEESLVSPHLLALAGWIAEYYLAPLGEVIAAALPGGFEGLARSRSRRAAAEDPVVSLGMPERLTLTADQAAAIAEIEAALARGGFSPILLRGVTASGKTEIYMRAAHAARAAGRQTLVLVPEVALGAQVVQSFTRRFGGRVGVLHSYLGVGERRRNWELARRGAVDIVVGARSAVFAPLPKLGLVIVDEEHEPAYKQSEQPRYHGRDVAVRRAQMLGAPVLLGSATASLESLANAARGKYREIRLPHRVDRRPMPEIRLVDLRREGAVDSLISPSLRHALEERRARGEQSLLFLNRRGHFHHTQCRGCGFVPTCAHCDIALTLHRAPPSWRCHYCDHREPYRTGCPKCGAELLRFSGAGTQRAEREIAQALPGIRVLRLDTDVARSRTPAGAVLAAFARGEADVLVGTQMIAKGLDFPRVTLVGVLDADVALHLPDFRAAERTFHLLVQVSGRSGRGDRPGEVFIQTCTPEHPAVAAAALGDEAGFIARELEERREAAYPPYTRLVALFFSGREEAKVEAAAEQAAQRLREGAEARGIEILGPAPQTPPKVRGRFRWHVLLKGTRGAEARAAAREALDHHEGPGRSAGVRLVADVDPVDVL